MGDVAGIPEHSNHSVVAIQFFRRIVMMVMMMLRASTRSNPRNADHTSNPNQPWECSSFSPPTTDSLLLTTNPKFVVHMGIERKSWKWNPRNAGHTSRNIRARIQSTLGTMRLRFCCSFSPPTVLPDPPQNPKFVDMGIERTGLETESECAQRENVQSMRPKR